MAEHKDGDHDGHHHDHGGCGHDHHGSGSHAHHEGDGEHGHHHNHNHNHNQKRPSEYNNGLLKRIFKGPAGAEDVSNNVRSTILFATAAGLTQIDTSGSIPAMAGVMGAAFVLANEASEELMESIQYVRDKLHIAGGAVGMVLSGAHVSTEALMAVMAKFSDKFNHASEYVVQVTMTNNLMHATAMTGIAGLAGALYLDKPQHRKMNIAAMTVTSSALGLQYVTNDYYWPLDAVGMGTAVGYALWRLRAGLGV